MSGKKSSSYLVKRSHFRCECWLAGWLAIVLPLQPPLGCVLTWYPVLALKSFGSDLSPFLDIPWTPILCFFVDLLLVPHCSASFCCEILPIDILIFILVSQGAFAFHFFSMVHSQCGHQGPPWPVGPGHALIFSGHTKFPPFIDRYRIWLHPIWFFPPPIHWSLWLLLGRIPTGSHPW